MASFVVVLNFNDGTNNYDLPHIFNLSDPKEGIKATIISGTRGDGSIVIPGGKKSQEIIVRGNLFDSDGYEDLTDAITDLKSKITNNPATLTLKHWTGSTWENDWSYSVRRLNEINFPESLRLDVQEYEVSFLVIGY